MTPFAPLFCASDAERERLGAQCVTADCTPGYPYRVSLAEAKIGETLILCNLNISPRYYPIAPHMRFMSAAGLCRRCLRWARCRRSCYAVSLQSEVLEWITA